MHEILIHFRTVILGILSMLLIFVLQIDVAGSQLTNNLQIHFFDVGQGDAVFIQTPDGVEVLIDGGANNAVLRELAQRMSFFDREIDMVIGTHPDTDHVGGLIDVLERYTVETILTTENEGESDTAKTYAQAVIDEGAEIVYARRGQIFDLGASTTLEVLFPEVSPEQMQSNASSIIVRLVYGETEVLLTGDSPKRIEEYLVLAEGENLQSDLLKIGHHGSRTSTSELFLAEVDPEYGVISVAKDSRYGHPHVEVTDLLFNYGVETYSTAEEGSITFESDGTNVWLQK